MQTPAHSALGDFLSYASAEPPTPGTLLRVPLGRREVLGVAWAVHPPKSGAAPADAVKLKPVAAVLDPAPTKAIYFVADGTGGHVFAVTFAEHQANVAKWYAIRRQRGEM